MKQSSPEFSNRGFSMIELMVAMVVGMVIVLAVTNAVVGNRISANISGDVARMQEASRFGFDAMSVQARMAGFHRDGSSMFDDTTANCALSERQAICGRNDSGVNRSDELRVRFYGNDGSTAGVADGATIDCAGNAINETTPIEERFRIANVNRNPADPATAVPTLVCAVVSGAAAIRSANPAEVVVPLVFGVESMQVLYGVDTNGDLQPDVWQPAGTANMARVYGVRVALLLASEKESGSQVDSSTYQMFGPDYTIGADAGAAYTAPGDRRMRKIVNLSVALRNRI